MKEIIKNKEYAQWLKELKEKVRKTQIKAALSVNQELLIFYWELGEEIVSKQKNYKWGSGFLKQLSKDLTSEFPDMKGFSNSKVQIGNLYTMISKTSNVLTNFY